MMSTHTHLHVMYTKRYSYLMTLMACGRKITANRRNLPAKCDKKEFFEIAQSHTVSPWRLNVFEQEAGVKLPDFKQWTRSGKMDQTEADVQIENWRKSQ